MASFSFRRPAKSPHPRRVIVVEDDARLGSLLQDTLLKSGFDHVEVCPSTACTLGKLRAGSFDAIVLDGHLADTNEGWGLAELVSALAEENTRIVFQTGNPDDIPTHVRSLGPVLTKPYDPRDLVEALSQKPRPGLLALLRRA